MIDYEKLAAEDERTTAEQQEKAAAIAAMIIPTKDRLLVRAESAANPSSALYIPEQLRQHCMTGVVVAAGAGTTIQTGQRVILGMFTGVKMDVAGVAHLICREEQIEGLILTDAQILAREQ